MIATAREPMGRRGAPGGTVALGGTEATKEPGTATPTDTVRTSPAIDAIADSPNHGSPDGTTKAIGASRSADDNSCFRCWCCAAHSEAMATEADGRPIGPKEPPSAAEAVDSLTGPMDLPNVPEAVDSLIGPRDLPNAAMAVDKQLGSMDLPSVTEVTEATIGHVADRVKAFRSFCLGRGRAIQLHSCPEASRSSCPTGSHPARAVTTKAVANDRMSIHRIRSSEQAFAVHQIPH